MKKLRMGVLGCSGHYALRVASPLKSSSLVEPYAVASRDRVKAENYVREYFFPVIHNSYDELLADPNVDFVYIPLPNNLHLEYIKKAADAGKPVLCEKPLCMNAGEAAEAAGYCRERHVLLMEAFMYRFHPQWIKAVEIVRMSEIGALLSVNTLFSFMNREPSDIRNMVVTGGGALYDIGCYAVSCARFLFGAEPRRVICSMARDAVFKTDILTSGILDFGEGKVSTFTVGTQMYNYQSVVVTGTSGRFSIKVPFNMYGDIPGEITINTGAGERLIKSDIADQYLREFDAFALAVIQGNEAPAPARDAVANMAVIDALFASARSNNWEKVTAGNNLILP
jgi:predicted dehydrogenase